MNPTIIWKDKKKEDETLESPGIPAIREDFCGACVALPLAFAGAGTATATSGDNTSNGSSKIFFWSVVISIISLIATIYFLKRNCKTCFVSSKRGKICSSSIPYKS